MPNGINEDTSIAQAIEAKGAMAEKIINKVLFDGTKGVHVHCLKEQPCCPGTSFKLGPAAQLLGKEDQIPALLRQLNHLPPLH